MSYRLKIILDTSIPFDKKQEVILTSKLLDYNPKRKLPLEEYPLFSPNVTYSRDLILRMPYHKRVELFFNTQKFKKNIMALWNGIDDNNEKERIKREKNNIDVFIAAILPTSYPVANNHERSYDFFESDIDNSVLSNIMSSFSVGEFSHLKINQKIYTVVGVIMRNDVFNHPLYSSFLQEFANVTGVVLKYDSDGFDEFYNKYVKYNELWDRLARLARLTLATTKGSFSSREENAVNQMHEIIESIFSSSDKKELEDLFNYLSEHEPTITRLDRIKATYSDIKELKLIVKEFGKIWVRKKALEYIKDKKFDFSSEGTREKEIREYIEKINPSFRKFSDMMKNLQKDRMIENKEMSELIKKMDTTKLSELLACRSDHAKCAILIPPSKDEDTKVESLLHVGLDRIKTKESSFTTIELYLMVNVIEGNINSENLKKIKCSYLDKALGSQFESFLHPLKTWDITNRKIFFSIQEDLLKIETKKKGKTAKKETTRKTRRLKN